MALFSLMGGSLSDSDGGHSGLSTGTVIYHRRAGWCQRAQSPADSDTIEVMAATNRSRSDSAVYGERLTRIAPPVSRIPSALVSSHA